MNRMMAACALATVLVCILKYPAAQAEERKLPSSHIDHNITYAESHERLGTHNDTDYYLHHLVDHAKDIGLNPDQLVSVKALQLDFDLARIKAEAEIMLTERELGSMFTDDKTEVSLVEAKIHQSADMKAGLRVTGFKALRKALALLTPEQREKSRRILAADPRRSERNS